MELPTIQTVNNFEGLAQERRFQAVHDCGLLDTPPEPEFDALTRLASKVLKTPVVLISLVDERRQFFKSQVGLPEPRETPHTHSFCQHVQVTGSPLVVQDARTHPLVHNNCAIPDLGVIAYAGVPLVTDDGVLGAFCAIDSKPREWTELDIDVLRTLAAQVSNEVQVRMVARRLKSAVDTLREQEEESAVQALHTIHDLRTPLSAMIMSMDLLATDPLTEEQAEFLELAQSSGHILLGMIGNLLGPSQEDEQMMLCAGGYQANELSRRAINQVRSLAQNKQISLTTDVPASLPELRADGEKILRILVNLLGNAIKFTPEGGRIHLNAALVNGEIEFSLEDTGRGIPMEEVERIFQPGVKLDKLSSHMDSTGLGLAFCKQAVLAHGGRIWVKSTPGIGSRFSFTIPVRGPGIT